MQTIDTHCHAGEHWMEPVESLVFLMDKNQVDKAVLTQFVRMPDNSYLVDCKRRFPGRFAVVGVVDNTSPDALASLEYWADHGIQGIRIRVMDLDTLVELPSVLKRASKLNLKLSCYGDHQHFASEEFRRLIEQNPDVPIIVEHFGFVDFTAVPPYGMFDKILDLAKYRNVFIKLHGFGEYFPRPPATKIPPFDFSTMPPCIEMAIAAFGAERMMIGSDWPESSASRRIRGRDPLSPRVSFTLLGVRTGRDPWWNCRVII